jgi:hypothetical protein
MKDVLSFAASATATRLRNGVIRTETLSAEKLIERFPDIFDLPTSRQNMRRLRHWVTSSRSKVLTRSGKRSEEPGNGLAEAIIRHGKLIYVDVPLFLAWFNAGRGRG